MTKKNKLNKTTTQVNELGLQVMSAGMSEKEAKEAQAEIAKRLTDSMAKMKPCDASAMKLGFIMFEHNIMNLHRLCEILNLGNALIRWDGKNYQVHQSLIDILEKKA